MKTQLIPLNVDDRLQILDIIKERNSIPVTIHNKQGLPYTNPKWLAHVEEHGTLIHLCKLLRIHKCIKHVN